MAKATKKHKETAEVGSEDLTKSLTDAAILLGGLVFPLLAVWFNYPITIPAADAEILKKALISLAWVLVIGYLYYRRKINRVYKQCFPS